MSSIEKLSLEFSDHFAVNVKVSKSKEDSSVYELRFSDLEEGTTFSFRISRNFSSTLIRLNPDAYSNHTLAILEEAIKENLPSIKNFIQSSRNKYSKLRFELGDQTITNILETQEFHESGITFEAKVFSDESDFALGHFNEQESSLIDFAIELFLIFLKVKKTGYISADEVIGYPEGASSIVMVNKYERNPKNRRLCIEHYGFSCFGCGFNFAKFYGKIAENFIVVHHVVPVSKLGPDYVIDPITDLIPLCANCHSVVHRVDPPLSIEKLRAITEHTAIEHP